LEQLKQKCQGDIKALQDQIDTMRKESEAAKDKLKAEMVILKEWEILGLIIEGSSINFETWCEMLTAYSRLCRRTMAVTCTCGKDRTQS
jgi:hypothetical protein